jgi:hypothetical protein
MYDVRKRYGHFVVEQVAGPRFNPRTRVLKISCDRHRAREDNRRQAMHWAIRLVEATLLEHPSEEWETLKVKQQELLKEAMALGRYDGSAAARAERLQMQSVEAGPDAQTLSRRSALEL